MKKMIFAFTLVCVCIVSQARTITKCGYFTQLFAMTAAVAFVNEYEGSGEGSALWTLTTFTEGSDGSWCFSMPVVPYVSKISTKPLFQGFALSTLLPFTLRPIICHHLTVDQLATVLQKKYRSHCGFSSPAAAEAAMNTEMEETKRMYFIDEGSPNVYGTQIDATGAMEYCFSYSYHL